MASALLSQGRTQAADCVHDQALEEPTDWLATRTPVVVGLKHFELISLNKILAAEQDCGDLLLFNQTTQTLGVDAEYASGLDKVQVVFERAGVHKVVFERAGVHNCKRAQAREDITTVVGVRQTALDRWQRWGTLARTAERLSVGMGSAGSSSWPWRQDDGRKTSPTALTQGGRQFIFRPSLRL